MGVVRLSNKSSESSDADGGDVSTAVVDVSTAVVDVSTAVVGVSTVVVGVSTVVVDIFGGSDQMIECWCMCVRGCSCRGGDVCVFVRT